MLVNIFTLLEKEMKLRVFINKTLSNTLKTLSNSAVYKLAKEIGIHPKTLERKIDQNYGNSFLFTELKFIADTIGLKNYQRQIDFIKIGNNSKWIKIFNLEIDENFIEGLGYYIGDGRTRTNRGISTINNENSVIKFFLYWLRNYFKTSSKDVKATVYMPNSNFNEYKIKREYSKEFDLLFTRIKVRPKKGKIRKPLIEIYLASSTLKLFLDRILEKIKVLCLNDAKFAEAYIRGILISEGSVGYNSKSGSRQVKIKMKSKSISEFNRICLEKVGCTPSLNSTIDDMWLVLLSGYDDLERIHKIDGFRHHLKRKLKLETVLQSYKRRQVKQGKVDITYLNLIFDLQKKSNSPIGVKDILEIFYRDRTRISTVLRLLYKKGLLDRTQLNNRGNPYLYFLTKQGIDLLKSSSIVKSQAYSESIF